MCKAISGRLSGTKGLARSGRALYLITGYEIQDDSQMRKAVAHVGERLGGDFSGVLLGEG